MPECSCGFTTSDVTMLVCPNPHCRLPFGDVIPPPPDHGVGEHDPLLDQFNSEPTRAQCALCPEVNDRDVIVFGGVSVHTACALKQIQGD